MTELLTEMAMAYFRSRVLAAAARLKVADALQDQTRSVDELAQTCQAHPESLYRLLRALASFGIVAETEPASFVLMPLGQPLRQDHPRSEWSSVVFWADLLADSWSHLTECVRSNENAFRVAEREGVALRWSKDPGARAIFGAVMGTGSAQSYAPIVRSWDFSNYHTIADLGGGGGALIEAVLEAYPQARGILADRGDFIQNAAPRFAQQPRCELVATDLSESVPAGADVHMLKHVLHGCTDEAAVKILRNCRATLEPQGRLLVIEFVLPDVVDHASPELEQRLMSDLNMLAVTGGRERSAREWRDLLDAAGFACIRMVPVPADLVSIIEAGSTQAL